MTSRFEITTTTTTLTLDASRGSVASFTVTNADPGTITGDAVVVPATGTPLAWFSVPNPSRTYPPGHTEQQSVAIAVPSDAPPGSYAFRLRVLLAGGVPEEDFDDSPVISFDVAPLPVEPPPPEPEKRRFPWWIVALIGVIVIVVVAGAAFFLLNQPGPGRLVFHASNGGGGAVVCELDAREGAYPLALTEGCADESARSLVMEGVPASMAVDVFGSPVCQYVTDWAEIRTQQAVPIHTIDSFEVDAPGPPASVDYRAPTGPWWDVVQTVEAVDPELIVAVGDGSARSEANIDDLATELERAGGRLEATDVATAEMTTDTFESMLESAVAQGADTFVVDAAAIPVERRAELEAVADRFDGIDIIWPLPSPEGLDGKVSCVRVSRVSA